MRISDQAYRDIAAAIGAENISTDEAVRASYAWNGIGANPGPNKLSEFWPSAIVLPGSTEDVQNIVRICNRHRIGFRAHSTGQFTITYRESTVALDLRRMDKLHCIDERNQMAVIEPYVTVNRLQAEAFKKGLTCHVVGAGPVHSPLASATAFHGIGITGHWTGNNPRNLLAFEWVTPSGEVLRCGSAGAGAGWFSGEGPGPGFRGMIRGVIGTAGGLGVFTRIGYKLHPWVGPRSVEVVGEHPQLRMPVPEHFRVHHISWESWENAASAVFEFKSSRIVNTLVRVPPDCIGYILMSTNEEYVERRMEGTLPPIARSENGIGWTVLMVAESSEEISYKDRVLRAIVERTSGRFVDTAVHERESMMLMLANSCYVHRVFRPATSGASCLGVMDSFALLPKAVATNTALLAEDKKPGGPLASTHPECSWIWSTEGRHLWLESVPTFRVADRGAYAAGVRFMLRITDQVMMKRPIGLNAFLIGPLADLYGYRYGNVDRWMRRIKNQYDPHDLSDSALYISAKQPIVARLWPILRKVVFTDKLQALVKWISQVAVRYGPN